MNPNVDEVFRLTENHIHPASEIIARAFQEESLLKHYFPDENSRFEKSKYIFEYLVRCTILYGEVYASSPNLEGIAAWRPPENLFISPEKQIECGSEKVVNELGIEFIKKVAPVEKYIKSMQLKIAPFPHWYLSPIVVDPLHQGKGYASILLRAMFDKIDSMGLPVYLNTHSEENVPMYQHFGFKLLKDTIIPNTDVPFWGMLRVATK